VWVEPTELGFESEEEYNHKLSCPSSTKYCGTEVGREKTAQKAGKQFVSCNGSSITQDNPMNSPVLTERGVLNY